jgi:hypothetical protein
MGGGADSGRTTMNIQIDINKIQFELRDGPRGKSVGRALGRHWIFRDIFARCGDRFGSAVATIDWSKPQTARSLYGAANWSQFSVGYRIAVGRVLRFFVKQGWLPLKVINAKATGTKRYVLAEPAATTELARS